MFVLPSILSAYIASVPILIQVYGFMFKDDSIHVMPIPTPQATI